MEKALENGIEIIVKNTEWDPDTKATIVHQNKIDYEPKVSIIIPTYNVEQYLVECMESIINQTLKDIEIICIDDGSTDKSGKIIDEYAAKDNRIKVIHKENGGYGKAMNVGLDNATGEYIGIVEPDDYVALDMYETLYNIAEENNLDFVKSDFNRFVGEGDNIKLFYNKLDKTSKYYNKVINIQEDQKQFSFIMNTWSGIYKRNYINKHNIRHNETPGASFQDNGFWMQTFWNSTRAYFLDKTFYMNRRDNPNSSVKNKGKVMAIKVEYDYIINLLRKDTVLYNRFIKTYQYTKFKSYLFNYHRIDITYKKCWLKLFSKEFKLAYKRNEIDESLFAKQELEMLHFIVKNYKKYYKNEFGGYTLSEQIFSIKNEPIRRQHKIITILGFKIKIKRKEHADYSFLERIFSVKNKESRDNKWYKVITILGLRFKFLNNTLTNRRHLQLLEQKIDQIENKQIQYSNQINGKLKNIEMLLIELNKKEEVENQVTSKSKKVKKKSKSVKKECEANKCK